MKEVDKAQKTPPGKTMDKNDVSVSQLLAIMKVSNPRREMLDGRSTLAFDFVGDPHAQTHGMAEDASKKLSGTLWVDEQDREVRRMIARFDDNFHLGFRSVLCRQRQQLHVRPEAGEQRAVAADQRPGSHRRTCHWNHRFSCRHQRDRRSVRGLSCRSPAAARRQAHRISALTKCPPRHLAELSCNRPHLIHPACQLQLRKLRLRAQRAAHCVGHAQLLHARRRNCHAQPGSHQGHDGQPLWSLLHHARRKPMRFAHVHRSSSTPHCHRSAQTMTKGSCCRLFTATVFCSARDACAEAPPRTAPPAASPLSGRRQLRHHA